MSTAIKGVAASTKVVVIPLTKLIPGKNHSRLYKPTEDEWKIIYNQLRPAVKAGTIDPIHVSAPSDKGKFTILAGDQRFRVAKELEVDGLPCLLTGLEPDSDEAILDNFAENIHRQDLSFVERAHAMQKYATLKGIRNWINSKEVARFFRVELPTLTLSKQILDKCSPKVQESLHRDEISVKAARVLAGFPEEVQDKLAEKAKQALKEENEEAVAYRKTVADKVAKAETKAERRTIQKEAEQGAKTSPKPSTKVTPKHIAKAVEEEEVEEVVEPEVQEKVKKAVTGAKKTTESKVTAAQDTLDMVYEWADSLVANKNTFVGDVGKIITKVFDRKLTPKAATKELEVMLRQEPEEASAA